jgi:hypothetical protein
MGLQIGNTICRPFFIYAKYQIAYICHMTKEQILDLRDRAASLRRHL